MGCMERGSQVEQGEIAPLVLHSEKGEANSFIEVTPLSLRGSREGEIRFDTGVRTPSLATRCAWVVAYAQVCLSF